MMVPKHGSWLQLVLRYRGTELPRTKYRIAGVVALAIAVTAGELALDRQAFFHALPAVPSPLLVFSRSPLPAVRTNTT